MFFTAQRRVEEVLEQQPSVRVSSPNLLYRGLRAGNDVELLQGVLVYALDHPHRIRNKRVIGALSEKGVEAVDVHLLLLGQMGFQF